MICTQRWVRHFFHSANSLCLIVGIIMTLICMLYMNSVLDFHLIYCLFGWIVGMLTVIAALIGYRAFNQSEAQMMWLYCTLLTILCVTQVYVMTHYQASNVITATIENVHQLWKREVVKEGPMARIESRFHCCGLHNYTDYTSLNLSLPASCFYPENDAWVYYSNGCLENVTFAACRVGKALSITGYALVAAQLLASIFSTTLAFIHHRSGDYQQL